MKKISKPWSKLKKFEKSLICKGCESYGKPCRYFYDSESSCEHKKEGDRDHGKNQG
jgi:hypothetical protein